MELETKIQLALTIYDAYLLYKQAKSVYEFCEFSVNGVTTVYRAIRPLPPAANLTDEEFEKLAKEYTIVEKEY